MQVRTLTDIGLTLVLVEGDLSFEGLRSFFAAAGPRPTKDVMFLCRNITSVSSYEEVRASAADARGGVGRPGLRTCYVIDSKLAFGVTRAFVSLAEAEGSTVRYVCSELAEGARWMGVDQRRIGAEFDDMARAGDDSPA